METRSQRKKRLQMTQPKPIIQKSPRKLELRTIDNVHYTQVDNKYYQIYIDNLQKYCKKSHI